MIFPSIVLIITTSSSCHRVSLDTFTILQKFLGKTFIAGLTIQLKKPVSVLHRSGTWVEIGGTKINLGVPHFPVVWHNIGVLRKCI